MEVEDLDDKVVIMAMMEGLRPGPLVDSLSKNVPKTLSILQSKADKYIVVEELAEAKRSWRVDDEYMLCIFIYLSKCYVYAHLLQFHII